MALSLDTEVLGIGNLLKAGQFTVPEHQRAYAWTESEVTDLWRDILLAMVEEPEGYFLGQVVFGSSNDSTVSTVIDGQQRLATVSLLYAATTAIFRERDTDGDDEERGSEIDRDFLASKNKKTLERTPYLQLGPIDNQHFQNLVEWATKDANTRPTAKRESHRRLDTAYDKLHKWLSDIAPESDPTWRETLLGIADYVQGTVSVINVQAGSEDNAYLIFETLNDRGVRLAPADLLKNLLFSRAHPRLPEVQESWANMVGIIETIDEDDAVTTFIRHHWISTRGQVRDKQLYKTIKDQLKTAKAVADYAAELAAAAEAYVASTNPEAKLWETEAERDALKTIILFRARTVRPLLLALAEAATPAQRKKLMVLISSWTVRLAIAGGLGSGSTEDAAGRAARAMREGPPRTVPSLKKQLGPSFISNNDFRDKMRTYRINNGRQARYLLRRLEIQERMNQGESVDLTPEMDEQKVNLEHVLPRSPAKGTWKDFKEDVSLYSARLGNQVLLAKKLNSEIKNGEYKKKSPELAKSKLLLTKVAGDKKGWGVTEIDERQERLAELAIKVWR